MEFDLVLYAEPRVKIQQVNAASEQNVLTIVDYFAFTIASRNGIRSRTSPEKRARFEKIDVVADTCQGRGRSHTGKTAASDDHTWHLYQINSA
jgi:hypothetical protein